MIITYNRIKCIHHEKDKKMSRHWNTDAFPSSYENNFYKTRMKITLIIAYTFHGFKVQMFCYVVRIKPEI